ncbi:SLAP domain-containing protein [Lactobacillus sp. B4005]|nr:SLAP domain-containing protein [Lactobacillus sp. B4005]
MSYTSIKKINGQKYYRVGKNKYIHLYDAFLIQPNNY